MALIQTIDTLCKEIKEKCDVLYNMFEQINSLNSLSKENYIFKQHKKWFCNVRTNLALVTTEQYQELITSIEKLKKVL